MAGRWNSPLRNGAATALASSVCFAIFFALLSRGKIVAPKQGAAVYRNMLRDVGADDSLPAVDVENLPEPASQPMADADRDANQRSSDEIVERRRTLLQRYFGF